MESKSSSKPVEVKPKRISYLGTRENPFMISRGEAGRLRSLTFFLNEEKKKRNFRVNFHPSKKVRGSERKLLSAQYWKFETQPGFWPTMENRLNLAKEGGDFMFRNFPQLHGLTVRDYFKPDLVFSMIITVPPNDDEAVATESAPTEAAPTDEKEDEDEDDGEGETDA